MRSKGGCDGSVQRAQEDRENYTPMICREEHPSQVPELCVFMTLDVVLTPYSFDFQKCYHASCCGVKRTPSQFQVLVIQRQPTSRLDKDCEGHFLSRANAQARAIRKSVFTNLEDLPPTAVDSKKTGARLKAK